MEISDMIGRQTWDSFEVQQYNLLNPSLIKKTSLKSLPKLFPVCLFCVTTDSETCAILSCHEYTSKHCDLVW